MQRQQTAKITMYRTRGCPFCIAAEDLLEARGLVFDQVYLDDHPDRSAFTAAILPGHGTVPLIVLDDDPLGGFDRLRELDAQGELERRAFAATS